MRGGGRGKARGKPSPLPLAHHIPYTFPCNIYVEKPYPTKRTDHAARSINHKSNKNLVNLTKANPRGHAIVLPLLPAHARGTPVVRLTSHDLTPHLQRHDAIDHVSCEKLTLRVHAYLPLPSFFSSYLATTFSQLRNTDNGIWTELKKIESYQIVFFYLAIKPEFSRPNLFARFDLDRFLRVESRISSSLPRSCLDVNQRIRVFESQTITIQTPSTNVKLAGGGEITDTDSLQDLYQLSISTGHTRSENPVEERALNQQTAIYPSPCSGNLVEGGGESLICSSNFPEKNYQVANKSNNTCNKKSFIFHSCASDFALKRKHEHMTRQNSLQEGNSFSKRSRWNIVADTNGEKAADDEGQNVVADQSDSTFKVSSGDSDLTAERMAEGNSRTSSLDNGCTLKLDTSPPATDASKALTIDLPFTSQPSEKFHTASSISGIHDNIKIQSTDVGEESLYRPQGAVSLSSKPAPEEDQGWLELGLGFGFGYRNHQSKQTFSMPEIKKAVSRPVINWNKDDFQQINSVGHTSKVAVSLPPSQGTAPVQISFNPSPFHQSRIEDVANVNRRIFREDAAMNKLSIQRNTDGTNYSTLNLLQPPPEDQYRSQNIAGCPTAPPSVDHSLKFQWHSLETSHSKEAPWQGFYDRISEAGRIGSSDVCISESRVSAHRNIHGYQGNQSFHEGYWNGLTGKRFGANIVYQNSDGPVFPGFQTRGSCQDTTVLQQALLEKMQCRAQWSNTDSFPSWTKPGISLEPLLRPSGSEFPSRKFPRSQYDHQHETIARKSLGLGPLGELQQFPRGLLAENARICRPARAQTGLWFTLQASNNQSGDRMLPQIPRNYLRIKDGTMTILVVKKYLVSKLGLNSESEACHDLNPRACPYD
eukprot:Gb_00899 [translate_table: standard]